ncbi:hypothetical protein ONZ45_g7320 [Pleurotus djamor]|nr:hypothetical protein ONZ45_g7320 [Pleurotus djamor]
MRKLTTNLAALKESQSESYSILPRPEPYKEPAELAQCASIDAILKRNLSPAEIHPITLLRCAISDFTKLHKDEAPTTEELFQIMEAKLPELASESGADMENALWDTLTTCPFFTGSQEDSNTPSPAPRQTRWTYNPPTPQAPTPMQASLHSLSTAMPQKGKSEPTSTVRQHALQALTNLTGYISTQVYLPYRPPGINTSLGPAEDEMRREIRALKGLVLNRRSFMPSLPRANTINGVQC